MPASNKMLKRREYAENKKQGIGDATGRLSHQTKAETKMAKCTQCGLEVRCTKTNTELGAHATSKHSAHTFEVCFPGISSPATIAAENAAEGAKADGGAQPKKDLDKIRADAAYKTHLAEGGAPKGEGKKKKPKEDLSFLDAAIPSKKK